jgi:hypothetical protein
MRTTLPSLLLLATALGLAAPIAAQSRGDWTLGLGSPSASAALRLDARWIDIDTDVSVEGVKIGRAQIDPLVYGLAWIAKL